MTVTTTRRRRDQAVPQLPASTMPRAKRVTLPSVRLVVGRMLDSMNDLEKVLYPGLGLLAAGFALSPLPYLALIVPGAIVVYTALRADPAALAELSELEDKS